MQIHGLNKLTLLDFPGRMACLIFTGLCNYRCPFCHNASLVLNPNSQPLISEEEILAFLTTRTGILEGVVISGGEPTLQPDLEEFIRKVRSLGYLVKLDTNGSRPEIVKSLLSQGLLDYVAMDIKNSPARYLETVGRMGSANSALQKIQINPTKSNTTAPATDNLILHAVRETAAMLMQSEVPYEFRTTLVRELHSEADLLAIAEWLQGADRYFLQAFRDSDTLVGASEGTFHAFSREEMLHFRDLLAPHFKHLELRGVD